VCIELALDEREAECDDPYGWHDQAHSSIGGIQLDGVTRWNHLPDLTDPATLGCLLALIRELRHDPTLHAHPYAHGWKWSGNYRCGRAIYDSEAEALIAALEAVP
jgi:hypothetical protein